MKKKTEWVVRQSNMRECFLRLVRRLRHTSYYQLPKVDEKFFKSFAESMRVDSDFFNCHAVSFAVVRQEPDPSKEVKVYLAALEFHAMNARVLWTCLFRSLSGIKRKWTII